MAELSPAAQAVLDAFRAVPDLRDCPSIAAALRAAADQVVPGDGSRRANEIRFEFLAIVTELENHRVREQRPGEPAVPEGREPVAVTEQPSDEELVGKLVEAANGAAAMGWDHHAQDAARKAASAVLAHWGNPAPAPPADGEVVEVVEWLREQLHVCLQAPWTPGIKYFGRAAELLERQATACAICERERLHQSTRAADLEVERQAAPVPVPVNERLPEPEDCDAEGRC